MDEYEVTEIQTWISELKKWSILWVMIKGFLVVAQPASSNCAIPERIPPHHGIYH